ncbi:MAG: hypothetical protein IT424_02625 [Pirellulales bacterium]|nr:hypothetical protein [Pirellulales bacterium]
MSEEVRPSNVDRAVRFRLRTLLWTTTALAVLAAVAGPLYRRAPAEGQTRLLIHWSALLAVTGLAYCSHQRDYARRHGGRAVRFVVWETSRSGRPARGVWGSLWLALVVCWIGVTSHAVALEQHSPWESLGSSLVPGLVAAGLIFFYSRRALFLCDDGMPLAKNCFVPWGHVHSVETVSGRPTVLKLGRLDGDVYIEVPADMRAALEEFLREKGLPVDDQPHGSGLTDA